jgi:hypothetical protein
VELVQTIKLTVVKIDNMPSSKIESRTDKVIGRLSCRIEEILLITAVLSYSNKLEELHISRRIKNFPHAF